MESTCFSEFHWICV